MKRLRTTAAVLLALAATGLGYSTTAASAAPPASSASASASAPLQRELAPRSLSVTPAVGASGTLVTISADPTKAVTTCTLAQDGKSLQKYECGPNTTIQFTVTGAPGPHTLTLCAPDCSPLLATSTASAVFTILAAAPRLVVVPELVGLRESDVPKALSAAGLKLGTATGPAGDVVVSQDPPSGNVVDAGHLVNVILGVGPTSSSTVVVPELRGLPVARARELTGQLGLKLVTPSSSGYVQSQKPPARTTVAAGDDVTVTIRSRVTARFVAVPDVRGHSVDAARTTLAGVGLILSAPANSGTVATQDLAPGRRVAVGATVTVTIELIAPPTSLASSTTSGPGRGVGWWWAIVAVLVLALAFAALAGRFTARRLRRDRARPRPAPGPPPRVTCRADVDVLHTRTTSPTAPTVEVRVREHTTLTMERKP